MCLEEGLSLMTAVSKGHLICEGGSFSGKNLCLVVAEVVYTDVPKTEYIGISLQSIEKLHKMKTGRKGYFKLPSPHREDRSLTLIYCLNYTHFYTKPLNCQET